MKKYIIILMILLLIPTVSAQVWNIHGTFVDHDTNDVLNPTALINGTSLTVSNGVFDFNVIDNSVATLTTSLLDYEDKTFTFGFGSLNQDNNIVSEIVILKSNLGQEIPFTFRSQNGGTILADANVTVWQADFNKVAGRAVTSSTGGASFFLEPNDTNYVFQIENTGTDFNTSKRTIGVNIPQDEDTLELLTPYSLDVTGIGNISSTNLIIDSSFGAFPYTNQFYIITVDANAEYFARSFYFRLSRIDQNFDESIFDNFNDVNGTSPDPALWEVDQNHSTGAVQVEDNFMKLNTIGDGSGFPRSTLKSISNFEVPIGGKLSFSFVFPKIPVASAGTQTTMAGMVSVDVPNPDSQGLGKVNFGRQTTGQLFALWDSANQLVPTPTGDSIKIFITIEKPNAATIDANWFINTDTNRVHSVSFADVTTEFYFWANTTITGSSGDTNGWIDDVSILGISGDVVLQPYLVRQADSKQITIEVSDNFDPTTKIGNIRIRSETTIPNSGFQQVETIVTDTKGQGVMSFIVGREYTLTLFDNEDNQLSQEIFVATPTSITYSISITVTPLFPTPIQKGITVSFIPNGGSIPLDTIVSVITYFDKNVTISDINIIVQQNDVNLFSIDGNLVIESSPEGLPDIIENFISLGNAALTNNTFVVIANIQTTDGNSFFLQVGYNGPRPVGDAGESLLDDIIRGRIKEEWGCTAGSSDEFCFPLMMFSLFAALLITMAIAFRSQILNINLSVALFMAFLGFAVYFYWFPWQLYAGMVLFGVGAAWSLFKVR